MSLEVLGGLAGISAAYLSMAETGKRRLDRYSLIVALAAALGVPPGDLTGEAIPASRLTGVRDE
jgi:transcriptional regulator with XRE-family HTH domain